MNNFLKQVNYLVMYQWAKINFQMNIMKTMKDFRCIDNT